MAYGVKTYTGTVGAQMDAYGNFEVSTADLDVSEYTIVDGILTLPITIYTEGDGEFLVDAVAGKMIGSNFSPIFGFTGIEQSFRPSDNGKTFQCKLEMGGGVGGSTGINEVTIIRVEADITDGSAYADLVFKKNAVIRLEITHTGKSPCFPPSSVTAPSIIHYHGGLRVQWNAGTAGNKSPVTGYAVYRSASASGTYTRIATLGVNARYYDDYDYAIGDTKYYKVKTLTDDHNYDSELSGRTGGTTALRRTTAPTIRTGASGGVYNPRPRILLTLGTDALEEALTVTSPGYQGRPKPMAASKMVLQRMNNMAAGQENITVTNTDTSGVSYSATAHVKVLSVTWTDDPIVAGETRVKAAHIMELRACLNNICDYYGLSRTNWGGDLIAGVSSSGDWPAHMAAIQATARRIAQFVNSWDAVTQEFGITLPFFETVNRANARAVNQMRQIITIL